MKLQLPNETGGFDLHIKGNGRNGHLTEINLASAEEVHPKVAPPVFESQVMLAIVRLAGRIGPSGATVLLTGESGTGKEVIADLLHAMSRQSQGRIVKINCAALPRELIESELFGSVKGAFTGATDRMGLFREAENGTLLLDEISEMPIDTQAKLLRVLDEKLVRPVGGKKGCSVNCRVIASTNRSPEQAIREGKLRADLFYRLSAVTIYLPPLRERRDDIIPLAKMFLKKCAEEYGLTEMNLTPEAESFLFGRDWPGNVRELRNAIQSAVLMTTSNNGLLGVGDFCPRLDGSSKPTERDKSEWTIMENAERQAITATLRESLGNKSEAAKKLGIGRQTLYNKIKFYKLNEFAASLS